MCRLIGLLKMGLRKLVQNLCINSKIVDKFSHSVKHEAHYTLLTLALKRH